MPHLHVEKGVTMPGQWRWAGESKNQDIVDVLLAMEVDESFTLPLNRLKSYDAVIAMLKRQERTGSKKWSRRKEDNITMRVWRVV